MSFRPLVSMGFALALVMPGAACSPHGVLAPPQTVVYEKMARDVADRLSAVYTETGFILSPGDAFETALGAHLRRHGHTVSGNEAPEGPAHRLRYSLDPVQAPDLYRLMVWVDDAPMARLSRVQNDTVAPAGFWMVRE